MSLSINYQTHSKDFEKKTTFFKDTYLWLDDYKC